MSFEDGKKSGFEIKSETERRGKGGQVLSLRLLAGRLKSGPCVSELQKSSTSSLNFTAINGLIYGVFSIFG